MAENINVDESLVQRLPIPLAKLVRRARMPRRRSTVIRPPFTCGRRRSSCSARSPWSNTPRWATTTRSSWRCSRTSPGRLSATGGSSSAGWCPVLADSGDEGFSQVRELVLGPPATTCPAPRGSMRRWSRPQKGKAAARATVRLTELFDRAGLVPQRRARPRGRRAAARPVLRADGRCPARRRGRGARGAGRPGRPAAGLRRRGPPPVVGRLAGGAI